MKIKIIFKVTLIVFITTIVFNACNQNKSDKTEHHISVEQLKETYTCPMHPSVVSDRPGACPVCGMALVKKMNQKEVTTEDLSMLHSVSLSPTQRVIANVATETVRKHNINKKITTVGVVDFAEPNLLLISARFRGRLEKLYANYTGEIVKKGQPLFELYSPDLISAQNELILFLKNKQLELVQIVRDKLKIHFGLSDSQIEDIEKSQKVLYTVPIHSPISGTIISKEIQEGQYVDEGMILYKIADLSKVWIYLDVYEKDLQFITIGSLVQVKTESYPNETLNGRITYIEPIVNATTRTVRIRSEFNNPIGKLKPQMYVTAQVITQPKISIAVPSSAVISTGNRNVVWIEVSENTFEPRIVMLGIQADELIEVISGLNEGEKVVVSGGFLLDSESQLQQSTTSSTHQHKFTNGKNTASIHASQTGNVVKIIVDGGYFPSEIQARKGQKLIIQFERHDKIACTDEVIFPDFNIKQYLEPHKTTIVEITPMQEGEYRFHCGMDMIKGKIIVR